MRKFLAGLAAVVLTTSVACAQSPFSDVPRDHWAYDAVSDLAQRGLLIGYPDGTMKGKQALTRYEFAVTLARLLPQFEQYVDSAVNAGISKIPPPPALPNDLVRRGDIAGMLKASDLDTLRRLLDEFGNELKLLRVDVDNLKKQLAALEGRVGAIEKEIDRVRVNGTLDVISRGSSLDRDTWQNGYQMLDKGGSSLFMGDNLLEANQMQYLLALGIRGKVTDKITANAVLDVDNYYAAVSAPRADFPYGNLGVGSRNASFGVYKAYIEAPILGINTEMGQFGVQFTPYTLKLPDYDYYTDIAQTDNGEYIATGIKGTTMWGGLKLTGYAATHAQQTAATAYPLNVTANFSPRANNPLKQPSQILFPTIPAASIEMSQSAGVNAMFGDPKKFAIGGTFIEGAVNKGVNYFDGNSVKAVRRSMIYGLNGIANLGPVAITGEWATSDLSNDDDPFDIDSVYPTGDNAAYDARATWKAKAFFLQGGYRQVDPFFGAPGSWGMIGSWNNPTNIKGWLANGGLNLGKALTLTGGYEAYESVLNGTGSYFNALESGGDTKIDRYTAGLKWNINKANGLSLRWEGVDYKDIAVTLPTGYGTDPKESYYDIEWATQFSANAKLKLLYQIIDYSDSFYTNGDDATGNVAMAQFSVAF